jgi:tripartite-type tricarboxylate transporter receptor subunit TctC
MTLFPYTTLFRSILNKLSSSVLDVLKMPDVQEKLRAQDVSPIPPAPEQFAEMIRTERQQFAKIIKNANIKPGN